MVSTIFKWKSPQGEIRAMQSHALVLPPCDCIAWFATRELIHGESSLAEGDRGGGSYYIIGISAGLAQLSQDTSILGFFWKRGKTPQKIIFEGDSKTTNSVVAEKKKKKKN